MDRIAIDVIKEKFVFAKINNVLREENRDNEEAIYASMVGFWRLDIKNVK